MTTNEYQGTFWGNRNDSYDYGVGYTTINIWKIRQIAHLKFVNFTACEYLNKKDFFEK